ncbi:MAG: heparinase [Planctomycetota bacterium]|nr:MAG: heparinase [Planctomycetota bacterium]
MGFPRLLDAPRQFLLCLLFTAAASAEEPSRAPTFFADGDLSVDAARERARGKPWSDRLTDLKESTHGKALVWLLTGDEEAAKAAIADLKAASADDGYGLGELGPVLWLPLAHDWLRDWKGYSAADRKETAAKIAKTADACLEFLKGTGDSVWHTSAPRAWMGIALAGAALDNAAYLKFAREYFENVYSPAMAAIDGGAVAGMSYGVCEGFAPAAHALWALRSRGYDGFAYAKAHGDWLAARLAYMAHAAAPDFTWQRWGDCVAGSRASLKEEARNVVDMLALGTGAAEGAWLSKRIAARFTANAGYHACVLPDFFVFGRAWPDDGAAPERFRLFGRDSIGQAYFRSGWEDDATAAFFKAGDYFDNHGHFDQGHFTIYRSGWLAQDSGTYGDFNAAHRMEYARKTVAHNTVVFGTDADGGQRIVNRQDFQDLADWQKKKRAQNFDGAEISGWHAAEGWAYVAANLAPGYDPKVVGAFVREIVWLEEGVLIVHDRTSSKAAPRWLLHSTPEPAIDGSAFTIATGVSKLEGRVLLPAKPRVARVGPGCLVDGKEIPPDKTADYAVPGAWRVEVAGGVEFLVVLVVSNAKAETTEATIVKDGDAVGVEVKGRRVVFRNEGNLPVTVK